MSRPRKLSRFHRADPGTRAGFAATTSIDRQDYGIESNIPLQGDQVLLGERIDIALEVQAGYTGS